MLHTLIWIGLFLPLASSLFLLGTSEKIGRKFTGLLACGSILIAFGCFATLLYLYTSNQMKPFEAILYKWVPIKGINADFAMQIDPLSLLMTLIITGVGFLIHIYSIGYIEHEEDFARYFACLNFFVFAMLLLVLASHLLVLFIGWEGVGLASYLLIGYWYHRPAAAQAATKAFVVNRIGDWGLLLGLLMTFTFFGTGLISEVNERAPQLYAANAPLITVLTLFYFCGAVGKSAQIPLHVWLPDAMEGPTPVSALIHAATMVTAGVYLVVRMHPLFLLATDTLHFVGVVGGITALFAALCAVSQTDLKRVLAYSTVSQLGLMFLACGVGAFYAAMFHLTTHAFVKGLLFLSAGNVVHMMNGATSMEKMGGLKKIFTKTHWLFLIGVLALSGVPPLAAFFSKDLILEEDYEAGFKTFFLIGLATSILTAFYMTRAYVLTFLGKARLEEKILKVAHEAPKIMLIPVTILAFLSIVGGFLGFAIGKPPLLENFLAQVDVTLAEHHLSTGFHIAWETWVAIIGAFLGIGIAYYLFTNYADHPIELLRKSFYVDELYDNLLVRPLKRLSRLISTVVEPKFFEGMITLFSQTSMKTASFLQKFQSGEIRSYVAWMALGSVLLIAYFVFLRF